MKKIISHKAFIAVLFFLLGGVSVFAYERFKPEEPVLSQRHPFAFEDKFLNDFFNQDFFERSRDPFEEMRRMRSRMLEQFENRDRFEGVFDDWYKGRFGGGDVGEVSQREDDEFLYLDVDLKGKTPKNFNVKVENGQVTIVGEVETKESDGSIASSRFERSFPAPPHVDSEKFVVEQSKDKMTIKFPKKSDLKL